MDFASHMVFLQADAGSSLLAQLPLFLGMGLIFYFLLIRPQQQRQKRHLEMVNNVKRGDTVVTSGGIVGKVTKVFDDKDELTIEVAENVRIKVIRGTLADVRGKGEPVAANDTKS